MIQLNDTTYGIPGIGDRMTAPVITLGGKDPKKFAPNLNIGFDISLSPPPAVDLSTAVLFTATRKGSVTHEVTQKTSVLYGVTRKGAITIDQLQGGNR